jgi:hypothetical protein
MNPHRLQAIWVLTSSIDWRYLGGLITQRMRDRMAFTIKPAKANAVLSLSSTTNKTKIIE